MEVVAESEHPRPRARALAAPRSDLVGDGARLVAHDRQPDSLAAYCVHVRFALRAQLARRAPRVRAPVVRAGPAAARGRRGPDATGSSTISSTTRPRPRSSTPLSDVVRQRRGVCQDFAHFQIGCLRAMGLPARYVSGYLSTTPPANGPRLVGCDASHAWVSTYLPSVGWVDFDPVNDLMPEERHVTVAYGRDYSDVTPIRGRPRRRRPPHRGSVGRRRADEEDATKPEAAAKSRRGADGRRRGARFSCNRVRARANRVRVRRRRARARAKRARARTNRVRMQRPRVRMQRPRGAGQTTDATAVGERGGHEGVGGDAVRGDRAPALKPYQPTQSMPVPTMERTRLCGRTPAARSRGACRG